MRRRLEEKARSPLLTIGEASTILHVHTNTLRRWESDGLIRAFRIGECGHRRFRREDIMGLLCEEGKENA